ncbi:MAG TPA: hypothetical protein VGN57_12355 [Pirellulaceae bacterium]|jgi:hypothetical protein|nr:hypothetical protein [Pirellulaceae bacterium]
MNRPGKRLRRPLRYTLALLALSGGALAATTTSVRGADEMPRPAPAERSAEALVEALGATEYSVREAAAAQLLASPSAKPALEAGQNHPDLEIRLRSGEILKRLVRDDQERTLSAFLADPASVEKSELPGWAVLEEAVGAGRTARETYVAIYRERPETLASIAKGPLAAEAELLRLTQTLQGAMQGRLPDMDDVVAAMLLDEVAPPDASFERVALLHNLLSSIQLQQSVHTEPETTPAMRLLKRWVSRDPGPALRQFKLRTALLYEFGPEALDLSRKTLAAGSEKQSSDPLATAMLAVGRYGTEADTAALSQYLDEDEICHTWFNGNGESIKIQVRDVAMAVALHLQDQDPKAFGFEYVQRDESSLFAIYTLGFENDADRARTLRKFGEWARTSKAIALPADFDAEIPVATPTN